MRTIIALAIFALIQSAHAEGPSNTKTQGGRFQLIQLSSFARDQYLLDTQTGKVWQKRCVKEVSGNCELTTWMIDYVEGLNVSSEKIQKILESSESK